MVQDRVVLRSFVGGEMSPEMFGRIDDTKFQNGAASVHNLICKAQGSAIRRPGFRFVRRVKDSTSTIRVDSFKFSVDQALVLEMGESTVDSRVIGYFRFHTNSATLLYSTPRDYVTPKAINAVASNEINFGVPHNLLTGDPIVLTLTGGTPPSPLVAGTIYYAREGSTANKILVATTKANALAGTTLTLGGGFAVTVKVHYAYQVGDLTKWTGVSPGNFYCMKVPWDTATDHGPLDTIYWYREPSDLVYEVPHFYAQAHLTSITIARSNDVLTLVHPHYPVMELRRLGATRWTFTKVTFRPVLDPPTNVQATAKQGAGFKVLAIPVLNPARLQLTTASSGIPHGFLVGDSVYVTGMSPGAPGPGIPDGQYTIRRVQFPETVELNKSDDAVAIVAAGSTLNGAERIRHASLGSESTNVYVVTALTNDNGESLASSSVTVDNNNLLVPGSSNTITWNAVAGAARYRIYKRQTGLYGFIGEVEAGVLTFKDDNIGPDLDITPGILDASLSVSSTVQINTTTDRVTWVAHGRPAGSPVVFTTTGALPTGLILGVPVFFVEKPVFVVNPEADSFQVAATPGGTPIDLTGSQSGTHTATSGDFPGAVGYFEQRRCFGGSLLNPQHIWMTRSGTESDMNYSLPIRDNDRISFRIQAGEVAIVRHIVPVGQLMVLTRSGEYRLTPVNSDAITPSSVAVRPQSYVGTSIAAPVVVSNVIVFCAERGNHVHELGFQQEAGGFIPGDVSLRAAHLFDGKAIVQMAYSKAPSSVVWAVTASGQLLGMTYIPEEGVGAWHHHDTAGGLIESVTVIPEGGEDIPYVCVRRTVAGATVKYIESMGPQVVVSAMADAFFVDSGLSYDSTPATVFTGLWHLRGESVDILADGIVKPSQTISNQTVTITIASPGVVAWVAHGLPVDAPVRFYTSDTLPTGLLADTTYYVRNPTTDTFKVAATPGGVSINTSGTQPGTHKATSGRIVLGTSASKVHVGLGYTTDLLTLPLIMQLDGFGQGRPKNINEAYVRVFSSGQFQVGPDEDGLRNAFSTSPASLQTGPVRVELSPQWQDDGRILIRVTDPVPLTLVGLTLEVPIGGG